ncbi:histone acetyltransferase KAT6A-like isoform X4 [Dunckerocampus dactyliophorus]|uniref:histone acetyltransferase KAT6A-like isoform X4 n=1 Tax=Dunckerocampus dactyliophorus TaxID=161453 RepID=UPI002404AF2B|nr:histone acetyltransferase KAT6A-like isoform X4 [Dunckerocampus dactyliophorus]
MERQPIKAEEEEPHPPYVKEEEEELSITQEGEHLLGPEEADLTRLPLTGVSVKTEDPEDKPPESSQLHHSPSEDMREAEPQPLNVKEEKEEPQTPYVKEEEEELSITQEGEHLLGPEEADLTRLPLTGVSVKTEDPEDKPPESSQLHHSPSEEMREAEPSCSSSLQHMTTEADGDHCGGSQADNLLAPLSDSDDTTSHSPEGEDSDFNQESLSSDTDCEGIFFYCIPFSSVYPGPSQDFSEFHREDNKAFRGQLQGLKYYVLHLQRLTMIQNQKKNLQKKKLSRTTSSCVSIL